MAKLYYTLILLVLLLVACGTNNSSSEKADNENRGEAAYRLNEPDYVFELPEELGEISGLSALSPARLLCIEDETGTLYVYNIQKESLEEAISWGEEGDYEGVAVSEKAAYVLQSNGDIYMVRNFTGTELSVRQFKNNKLEDCDAEGLSLLPGSNRLLIACKEGGKKESRSIHAFDLNSEDLEASPYLELSFKEMEEKLLNTGLDRLSVNLRKFLNPKGESDIFFPSGIAFHPLTKDLYVLSAKTKLLAVYTARGELKDLYELRHERFLQPEAIAFTPNGDMYIGNEGKGGAPNILKFTYVKK